MDDEIRAAVFGMFHATSVAIRALVKSHPDHAAMVAAFASEHHESMSILLGAPLPDDSIDAYKDFLLGCAPNPEEWLS